MGPITEHNVRTTAQPRPLPGGNEETVTVSFGTYTMLARAKKKKTSENGGVRRLVAQFAFSERSHNADAATNTPTSSRPRVTQPKAAEGC